MVGSLYMLLMASALSSDLVRKWAFVTQLASEFCKIIVNAASVQCDHHSGHI